MITEPCLVCQVHGRPERGADWPKVAVAGAVAHRCCEHELISCQRITDEATVDEPVVRWHSNGRCVPDDLMRMAQAAFCLVTFRQVEDTAAARKTETAQLLADYRTAQAGQPVPAEQRAEARAAFGPGAEVVDVISGRRYTT